MYWTLENRGRVSLLASLVTMKCGSKGVPPRVGGWGKQWIGGNSLGGEDIRMSLEIREVGKRRLQQEF